MTLKTLGKAAFELEFGRPRTDDRPKPAVADFSRPASVALPGPRVRTSSADGLRLHGGCPVSRTEAVRGCSSNYFEGTLEQASARPGTSVRRSSAGAA
jgi:hypothetical protein